MQARRRRPPARRKLAARREHARELGVIKRGFVGIPSASPSATLKTPSWSRALHESSGSSSAPSTSISTSAMTRPISVTRRGSADGAYRFTASEARSEQASGGGGAGYAGANTARLARRQPVGLEPQREEAESLVFDQADPMLRPPTRVRGPQQESPGAALREAPEQGPVPASASREVEDGFLIELARKRLRHPPHISQEQPRLGPLASACSSLSPNTSLRGSRSMRRPGARSFPPRAARAAQRPPWRQTNRARGRAGSRRRALRGAADTARAGSGCPNGSRWCCAAA